MSLAEATMPPDHESAMSAYAHVMGRFRAWDSEDRAALQIIRERLAHCEFLEDSNARLVLEMEDMDRDVMWTNEGER